MYVSGEGYLPTSRSIQCPKRPTNTNFKVETTPAEKLLQTTTGGYVQQTDVNVSFVEKLVAIKHANKASQMIIISNSFGKIAIICDELEGLDLLESNICWQRKHHTFFTYNTTRYCRLQFIFSPIGRKSGKSLTVSGTQTHRIYLLLGNSK